MDLGLRKYIRTLQNLDCSADGGKVMEKGRFTAKVPFGKALRVPFGKAIYGLCAIIRLKEINYKAS